MSLGLLGKKVGMTRVFNKETGVMIPVTVIDVAGNAFVQTKTAEKDGYSAVQVAFDDQKESRMTKAELAHLKKNNVAAKRHIKEFRFCCDEKTPTGEHPGVGLFEDGQWVDVIGTSKGKGFQGVVKRYNFSGQPAAHGSMMHRRTGAIGCRSTPGRVWKNQKMPGRHGNYHRTVQNLQVVQVRPEDGVVLISGAVPGAKGSYLVIRPAKKKAAK